MFYNHHLQVKIESLGNALHKKDYYGKEAISEPQVWSGFQPLMTCFTRYYYWAGPDNIKKGGDHIGKFSDESSSKGGKIYIIIFRCI